MLSVREKVLLTYIIEDYIKTAQPVGSDYLVKTYALEYSSATVRNDMASLEEKGYLESPHTSAGRIPTQYGYEYYVDTLSAQEKQGETPGGKKVIAQEKKHLARAYAASGDERTRIKQMARTLADLSDSAVIVGFDQHDVYYTGIAHLLAQPEFKNFDLVYTIGEVVDRLDGIVPYVFADISETVTVKIGNNNPFSENCSFLGFTFVTSHIRRLFGLLGPLRMPYREHMNRLVCVQQLLSSN